MTLRPLIPGEISLAEAVLASLVVATERLHPEEREVLATLGPHRAREFAAGRALARSLLADRGRAADSPLLPGPTGAPIWPPGTRGSITHAEGRIAVAVAGDEVGPFGIDLVAARAEVPDSLPPSPLDPVVTWAVVEAAYKAIGRGDFDPGGWVIEAAVTTEGPTRGRVRRAGGDEGGAFRAGRVSETLFGAFVRAD